MDHIPNNQSLFLQLMNNMTDQIFFKDLDSNFVLVNEADAKWLGLQSAQEAIGKNDFDLFPAAFAQATREDEMRVMTTGEPLISKAEKETGPDGSTTWVSTTKVALRDKDQKIIGLIGISRDISELKQKELELETANRELSETNRQLSKANRHISKDLRMAARLQQTFLPKFYPEIVSASGKRLLEFHHFYEANIEIGGDFCTVQQLSSTKAGLLICDVMGHGVRAALVTSMIRTIADNLTPINKEPGPFLTQMNRRLHPMLQSDEDFLFATACYITIDAETGVMEGAIAGHTTPLLIQPRLGKVTSMNIVSMHAGPALAITSDHEYQTFSIPLHAGDEVLMYTDGISEALNANRDEFGTGHLQQTVQNFTRLPLKELLPKIVQVVRDYAGKNKLGDDICLLGFTLNGLR